jgi:hypothetical protein
MPTPTGPGAAEEAGTSAVGMGGGKAEAIGWW